MSLQATRHLTAGLEQLALGCHRYRRQEKSDSYNLARDLASRAVAALALSEDPQAAGLLEEVEQELMPALAGLVRYR